MTSIAQRQELQAKIWRIAIVSNPPYSVKWIGSDDPTLIND
ncbi:MAG: hypothetical protein ACK5L5_04845 [Bacteroidales bacterium]